MITCLHSYKSGGTAFTTSERMAGSPGGDEDVEAGQMGAGDAGEVVAQGLFEAAELVIGHAEAPGDTRRRRATMPRDDNAAARADDAAQFADTRFDIGP